MTWRVVLTPTAVRERSRLEAPVRRRVDEALQALKDEPRPGAARKLVGRRHDWRLRIGDHRVLYEVDDRDHIITIWRIAHRRDAYR
jgi:mRNA interferase RelE/StbE